MAEHHLTGGHDPSPHCGLPVGVPRRRLDLPDHDIDDAVEDVLLVPDVVVERIASTPSTWPSYAC